MYERLEFKEVFKVDGYGLIIHFNDNTHARYTVEELANIRPSRERSEKLETDIGPLNVD